MTHNGQRMRVWGVTSKGVWLGAYSVVVASTEEEARALVEAELTALGLSAGDLSLEEVSPNQCRILTNGDY